MAVQKSICFLKFNKKKCLQKLSYKFYLLLYLQVLEIFFTRQNVSEHLKTTKTYLGMLDFLNLVIL